MKEKLEKLLAEGRARIEGVRSEPELQEVKALLLGKQGSLTELLKELPKLDVSLRPEMGKAVNQAKGQLTELLEQRRNELKMKASEVSPDFDISVPGTLPLSGGLHPITQMCYDLNDAFRSMGFEIYEEDDITSELYGFDNLNFPPNHPARESMDTYWLEGHDKGECWDKLCLRPHLTGGSVRYMQTHKPPYRFVYPGKVYRNETTDARHERAFFQYEALIVDKDFTFASGKVMIKSILSKVFGRDVPVRMRAGFFPFVEPGFEIDMGCLVCGGKGCSVCKHVGWIEVMPGGTPHPNVLKAAGLDPDEYTGFYVNIGLDRLVMMRYGVDDVRLFHSADLRFLERTVKLLLWSVGGWRVRICGCDGLTRRLADIYGSHGSRAFDASLMETVFRRPFTLESVAERDFPAARSGARKIGGHLSGCRIGFDAGGSDRKVSAVINGEMVYAEEVV